MIKIELPTFKILFLKSVNTKTPFYESAYNVTLSPHYCDVVCYT